MHASRKQTPLENAAGTPTGDNQQYPKPLATVYHERSDVCEQQTLCGGIPPRAEPRHPSASLDEKVNHLVAKTDDSNDGVPRDPKGTLKPQKGVHTFVTDIRKIETHDV